MTKARLTALVLPLLVALTVAAVRVSGSARPTSGRCGGSTWHLKTLSDGARNVVQLTPRTTSVAAIVSRGRPNPLPVRRVTPFQKQTWEVVAEIVNYRSQDGALRLILYDDNVYIRAAIPAPSCLPQRARDRNSMVEAWNKFSSTCAKPRYSWQPLGAVAYIRGVGFWAEPQALHGTAPNGAELNPVTGFRIVAGCG